MFRRKVVCLFAGTGALGTFAYYRYKKRDANQNRTKLHSFNTPALLFFNEKEENVFEDFGMDKGDINEAEFTNYVDDNTKESILNICLDNELTKEDVEKAGAGNTWEELVWDEETIKLVEEEFPQVLDYAHRIIEIENLIEERTKEIQMVKEKKKEVQEQCKELIQNTIRDQSLLLEEFSNVEYDERDQAINSFVISYLGNAIKTSWETKATENLFRKKTKEIQNLLQQIETQVQQTAELERKQYEQQLQGLCQESREQFSSLFLPEVSQEHFAALEDLVDKTASEMKRARVELDKLQRAVVLQMELQKLLHHPGRAYFPKALLEEIHVVLEDDSLQRVLKNKQMDLLSLPALKGELRKLANQKTVPVSPESTMIGQSLGHLQKCLSNPPEFIAIGSQTEDILDRTCYFLERRSSLFNAMKEIETLPPPLQLILNDWKYKAQDRIALEITNKILLLTIQEALHKYNKTTPTH
eukprot:TRINITY_DN6871_c0_g1_i1.p1 TRINITY_DN6871_c0_g1~~TRINITY_DN6871_c0_g1_i1.p1  ORF type:complete len:472 (+),score=133.50 TRINITY_DN6871_c0_g1_i1:15-1430(+)